jgi:caa(3)-type oxidase subunit IV
MGQDTWIFVTLWLASGAFVGGVVTPVLAGGKQFNDWLSMILGVGFGAIGNVVLLLPLWAFVMAQKANPDPRTRWQRDAISLGDAVPAAGSVSAQDSVGVITATLKANFWPTGREHSHRMTYVGVFVALAIITIVEVAVTYANLPFSATPLLVAFSTAKVLLVALYFMHLRYDSRWYAAIFVFGAPFAALIVTVLALSA